VYPLPLLVEVVFCLPVLPMPLRGRPAPPRPGTTAWTWARAASPPRRPWVTPQACAAPTQRQRQRVMPHHTEWRWQESDVSRPRWLGSRPVRLPARTCRYGRLC